jgi:hypothetical protein
MRYSLMCCGNERPCNTHGTGVNVRSRLHQRAAGFAAECRRVWTFVLCEDVCTNRRFVCTSVHQLRGPVTWSRLGAWPETTMCRAAGSQLLIMPSIRTKLPG